MAEDDGDVWESDKDERSEEEIVRGGGARSTSELDREWQARQAQFHTLGYRDGVEEGKNSSVQEGFDEGYREAAIAGFNWGVARGITSAFAALPVSLKEKLVSDVSVIGRLEALHTTISALSSTDALRSYYRDSVQPSAVRLRESHASAERSQLHNEQQQVSAEISTGGSAAPLSMAGVHRLPETDSGGVWEQGQADEALSNPSGNSNSTANLTCNPNGCACIASQESRSGVADGASGIALAEEELDAFSEEMLLEENNELAPLTVRGTPVLGELDAVEREVKVELQSTSITLS
ncbi:hypothetical protein CY35_03G031900 [Sphagnum magellanicum]|nr:hypothetical protein CY35_03G031900 [Sphagnum magellanicum]